MSIALERRKQLVSEYRVHSTDSGSPEVQIALLTEQISELSNHLQTHAKDNHSRRGLVLKVARRNRLLKYLAHSDRDRYTSLIGRLGLRK
ncbi:MAG: 30S ribosomal protein S15 [Phycisphaerales bacterium]